MPPVPPPRFLRLWHAAFSTVPVHKVALQYELVDAVYTNFKIYGILHSSDMWKTILVASVEFLTNFILNLPC